MPKEWTKGEERALGEYSSKMSIEELDKKFEVNLSEVREKEKSLGIIREHPGRQKVCKKVIPLPAKKWTKREEQYPRNHFEKMTNVELAEKFKTTAKSVESKLRRMGLRRRRKPIIPEEERRRKIEELLRHMRQEVKEERRPPAGRGEAIAQFDRAVQLYYAKKYRQAETAFEKIVKSFGNTIDVVCKAKQYIKFCRESS